MMLAARTGICLMALVVCHAAAAQSGDAAGRGQDEATERQVTPKTYWLRITGERVNLRSRADANSVAVMMVDRDAVLRATGSEFGWHQVIPPPGVFSYVAARYVDQRADETGIISVRSGNLRVRVGSVLVDLDPWQSEVQTRLPRGTTIRIIGRQGEWLKIEPPAGVYAYVSADYVARVSDDVAARLQAAAGTPTSRPGRSASTPDATAGSTTATPGSPKGPDLSGPWGQRLTLVEAAIEAEGRKAVAEQSWTAAIARLRPIAEQRAEPMVARLAAAWIDRLVRLVANQDALAEARRIARREARDQGRFTRELERIQRARQQSASQPAFDARGELLPSLALSSDKRRRPYKLQDPLTGRVTAYVVFPRASKINPTTYVGKYVGVRGKRGFDAALGVNVIRVAQLRVLRENRAASRPSRRTP